MHKMLKLSRKKYLLFTSSKTGLLPFLIRVRLVCPDTVTLTTGLMLMPGNCRASMTRMRIWQKIKNKKDKRTGLTKKFKEIKSLQKPIS